MCPDEPGTYWRRRAVTLAAGLGVLGLLAWALSSGGGKPGGPAAQDSPASGTLSAPASPGASASSQASSAASPAGAASAAADAAVPGLASHGTSGLPPASRSSTAAASRRSAGARATAGDAQAAAGPEPGGRCAPSAVVLSLFSGSRSYRAGQDPVFGVDAVSTAPGACTFGLGPRQLHLVVMSAGRVIWDSADCARGGGTQPTRLTRGVPVRESFTWNRAVTLPGCVTLASSARAGSYSAQARTASIASGVYTFRLVR